jgi:diguanylate cyclase (GGDEF)-like protein
MGDETNGAATQRRSGRILVVEDSRMMRAMLGTLLANVGYHDVLMAENGGSAFRLLGLEEDHPGEAVDLILMDFVLPDLDGIAAIRAIKARDELRNVPILMVTAMKEADTLREAFEAGASDYITKPLNEIELLARVGSAMRLKAEIDQREARERELLEAKNQLERFNRQLEQLSLTDGLTGVANRRHFDQALHAEWTRAARSGSSLALALIDIDHFKRYNDTYGHQEGDRCLQRVSAALERGAFRPGDLVARYGGEEFAVIRANTGLTGARTVSERICEEIAALAIPHAASSAVPIVSLSVGVAAFLPDGDNSPEALIAAADRALYQAKERGRNRVEVAERGAALVAGGVGQ